MTAKANGELRVFGPALALLVLAVLINYVDRGNLSLAAPLLKVEWGLSASELGVLFSAFYWTYVVMQLVVGWLVDRFSAALVMALGVLVWSLATAATGLVTGFTTLLLMRLLLGFGESVVFPASSKICVQHLSEHSRGFANGTLSAAMRWGSAIGTFGGGMLIAKYGWRMSFIVIGLLGLLWLPAWKRWKPGPAPISIHEAERPEFCNDLAATVFLGSGHRPLLRKLSRLFRNELAALLPCQRVASLDHFDGGHRRRSLPGRFRYVGRNGFDRRSMHQGWW